MDRNAIQAPLWLVWPAAFLGASGTAGVWFGEIDGSAGEVVLSVAAMVASVTLGVVLLLQVRAVRRLYAVLDAYAEREIDRERRRQAAKRLRDLRSLLGVQQSASRPANPVFLN
jgi:hypothetical protein